jgi:hypothetical protein
MDALRRAAKVGLTAAKNRGAPDAALMSGAPHATTPPHGFGTRGGASGCQSPVQLRVDCFVKAQGRAITDASDSAEYGIFKMVSWSFRTVVYSGRLSRALATPCWRSPRPTSSHVCEPGPGSVVLSGSCGHKEPMYENRAGPRRHHRSAVVIATSCCCCLTIHRVGCGIGLS